MATKTARYNPAGGYLDDAHGETFGDGRTIVEVSVTRIGDRCTGDRSPVYTVNFWVRPRKARAPRDGGGRPMGGYVTQADVISAVDGAQVRAALRKIGVPIDEIDQLLTSADRSWETSQQSDYQAARRQQAREALIAAAGELNMSVSELIANGSTA